MKIISEEEEQGFQSDSTIITCSSASVDLLCQRLKPGIRRKFSDFNFQKPTHPIKSRRTARKHSKSAPKGVPGYKVGRTRKPSLVQVLEKHPLSRGKSQKLPNFISPPTTRNYNKRNFLFKSESPESDCRARGDNIRNQVQIVCPAFTQHSNLSPEPQVFPFRYTPSGNYKLKPSQVVYESKNLSIVAADPNSITLNVTESGKTVETEAGKKTANDNYDTTCLYTAAGNEGKIPFGSEFSDSVSESDYGVKLNQTGGKTPEKHSEISLAKMGYVTDNCVDWAVAKLPNKSELQKLLLHNILNMINPDIEVKIGSSVYYCHRIVLQSYCMYFSTKLEPQVELPEDKVPKEIFPLIYQWMLYLGPDSYTLLRRDNILDIFKVAQFLGIKELENQCWAFIDNVELFCEDKAFLLYLQARQHNNQDIMELMVSRVQRFFLTLVSSKEFVDFSVKEVCTFLRSNYICIHSEVEVFMAAVRWLSHDWQARKQYAVELMKCVRFAFIEPQTLITIKRNPESPEFQRIANIPEVSQMIDDGISLSVLKSNFKGGSEEDLQTSLKALGLTDPVPRNWAGTGRNYKSYHEFLQDLAHYRSKQRLEIKKSKMKIELDRVEDGDFLSSAVLLPETHQKIKTLHENKGTTCLSLEPNELNLLKKIICHDERTPGDRTTRQIKSKLYSMAEEKYRQEDCGKPCKVVQKRPASALERDAAARTIQRAYRGYSRKTSTQRGTSSQRGTSRSPPHFSSQQIGRYRRSRSDPSLPSGLLTSSTYAAEKCNEESLPLQPGKETVFILGGADPFLDNNQNLSAQKIYRYEPNSNIWKKCGELPEPCHYHSAVYFRGKIYVAGGKILPKGNNEHGKISRRVWCYNSKLKTWCRVCDMHYARRSFGFVVSNKKIFAIGGRDEHDRVLSSVEKYDQQTNSWTSVRAMNMARAGPAACEFNGRIWVAGGLINNTNVGTNSVEYYNHHQNMWIQYSSLRYCTGYGVLVPVESHLYLIGGAIGLQDMELSGSGKHIDMWEHESQTWCLASMMSKPRHAHAAVYLPSALNSSAPGLVFILGGMSTKHHRVTDNVECWCADDDQWLVGIAPLPHPVSGLAALALPVHTFN